MQACPSAEPACRCKARSGRQGEADWGTIGQVQLELWRWLNIKYGFNRASKKTIYGWTKTEYLI